MKRALFGSLIAHGGMALVFLLGVPRVASRTIPTLEVALNPIIQVSRGIPRPRQSKSVSPRSIPPKSTDGELAYRALSSDALASRKEVRIAKKRNSSDASGETGVRSGSAPDPQTRIPAQAGLKTPGQSNTMSGYYAQVRAQIERSLNYPDEMQDLQGRVWLKISLAKTGALISSTVRTTSGVAALDALALAAIRRAAPFQALPSGGEQETIVLPIDFVSQVD